MSDHFIDKLDDDDEPTDEQMVDISFDSSQEKQLSYFEQLILKKAFEFGFRTVGDVWIL